MKFILAVLALTSSLATAQVPHQKTQPIRPHRKQPMRRPGAGNNQEMFRRNHVTAPLGESAHSVPNEPGVIDNIKASMMYGHSMPATGVAPSTSNTSPAAGPDYIHN